MKIRPLMKAAVNLLSVFGRGERILGVNLFVETVSISHTSG
jgi:hypothetical protein